MSTPNPATTNWVPLSGLSTSPPATLSARVYRSTAQSIPTATFQPITYDTVRYDSTPAFWNAGTPTRLTAPVAGTYVVSASAELAGAANTIHRLIWIVVNGVNHITNGGPAGMTFLATGNPRISCATTIKLNAGDYCEVQIFQDSGAALNTIAGSSDWDKNELTMALIGGPPGAQGPPGNQGPAGAPGGGGSAASGTLIARPAASGYTGIFYYATDQDVLYFSNGTTWLRVGLPAGATTRVYSNTVPNGWWPYDGTALPSSSGIYADLYAALGNTTTCPDTRGRLMIGKGTHVDVSTLGNNDGAAVGNRSARHVHTNGLGTGYVSNDHSHAVNINSGGRSADHQHASAGVYPGWLGDNDGRYSGGGGDPFGTGGNTYWTGGENTDHYHNVYGNTAGISANHTHTVTGTIGPAGTWPVDNPSFITFSVALAKL